MLKVISLSRLYHCTGDNTVESCEIALYFCRCFSKYSMSEEVLEESPTCYDNAWDAAQSVEDAQIWLTGLRNTGLNTILGGQGTVSPSPSSPNVLFVVRDQGLLPCDAASVFQDPPEWPLGDCAQRTREWMQSFEEPGESRMLMYHWIPGQTKASLRAGEAYPTLLADAVAMWNQTFDSPPITDIVFQNNSFISSPEGIPIKEGRLGGYQNASIVDQRVLCDPSDGAVFVLDRPLHPVGLPSANATSLPQLENYCSRSTFQALKDADEIRLPAELAMTAYMFPFLESILSPGLNVTVFVPKFTNELMLLANNQLDTNISKVQTYVASYITMMMVEGGRCPDDFKDGMVERTVFGDISNENVSLMIQQEKDDSNMLEIGMMLGDETGSTKYKATYLGSACYSTFYRLDAVIVPFDNINDVLESSEISLDVLADAPKVQPQGNLFNVPDLCSADGSSGLLESDAYQESTSSSSIDGGELAGIIVGICAFFGIIAAIVVWWVRRRREKHLVNPREFDGDGMNAASLSSKDTKLYLSVSSSEKYAAENSDFILKDSDVKIERNPESGEPIELGRGRFGRVFLGSLYGKEQVAIKCISDDTIIDVFHVSSEENRSKSKSSSSRDLRSSSRSSPISDIMSADKILKEISLLKSCSSENIVSYIGVMFTPDEVRLITELMPAGDLWRALGRGGGSRQVTWYHGGIFIAMDVAAGLQYLHEKKRVIHLDLKSSNILLRTVHRRPVKNYDGTHQAKLSDVGLSKMLPQSREYLSSLDGAGTWNWCAPEVLLNQKCTYDADMYSYGIVLWELCTGEIPVRGCLREVLVPQECPQEVSDLIHACIDWNQESSKIKRPTAREVFEILQGLLKE